MIIFNSLLKQDFFKHSYSCNQVRANLLTLLLAMLTGLFFLTVLKAQTATRHDLQQKLRLLEKNKDYLSDTAYANTINDLAFIYADSYPDSAISLLRGWAERCKLNGYRQGEVGVYTILGNAYQTKGDFKKAMDYYDTSYLLAKEINFNTALPGIMNDIGLVYLNQGNYPVALNNFYQALKAAEKVQNNFVIGSILNNIATIHFFQQKMVEAAADYQRMLAIAENMSDTVGIIMAYNNIGEVKLEQDSAFNALHYLNIAFKLATLSRNPEMLAASTKNLGNIYYKLDSLSKSISYFNTAITLSRQQGNTMSTCKALIGLARAQNKKGQLKEALLNALEAVGLAKEMGQTQLLRDASEITANIYEVMGDGIRALQYYRVFKISSDSINNAENGRAAATYKAEYTFSKKELEFQRKDLQQRWLIFSSLAALLLLSVIVWMVNRNRKRLNHANKDLHHKNALIESGRARAEEALTQLKAAQSQLVQAEKMASLGELVAGIAHEIQNPLNFVNNFSEVNKELLTEMKGEIEKGNLAEVKAIAGDVMDNEDKINHHGKRADSIVRGMLQHSRSSSGVKEPTDINALAGEYLRLSYIGLRGKDPVFNPDMLTDFDPAIGKINVIPQDIGRVLLNLFNNAFYAVNEKKKLNGQGYEPAVSVSTKRLGNEIYIRVKDNGTGISEKVVAKIFQPFFTTKPTGQGTGLGLSLSYDIITKGHGGKLMVETTDGVGSEFAIVLSVV